MSGENFFFMIDPKLEDDFRAKIEDFTFEIENAQPNFFPKNRRYFGLILPMGVLSTKKVVGISDQPSSIIMMLSFSIFIPAHSTLASVLRHPSRPSAKVLIVRVVGRVRETKPAVIDLFRGVYAVELFDFMIMILL